MSTSPLVLQIRVEFYKTIRIMNDIGTSTFPSHKYASQKRVQVIQFSPLPHSNGVYAWELSNPYLLIENHLTNWLRWSDESTLRVIWTKGGVDDANGRKLRTLKNNL